jgi:hypothetical protein
MVRRTLFRHRFKWVPRERPSELTGEFWAESKGADDVFKACHLYVPRNMWIEAAGDPTGLCYAPWLCLSSWLFVPYSRLKVLLGEGFGKRSKQVGLHRAPGTLFRSVKSVQQPVWWFFTTPQGPRPSILPGWGSQHYCNSE